MASNLLHHHVVHVLGMWLVASHVHWLLRNRRLRMLDLLLLHLLIRCIRPRVQTR